MAQLLRTILLMDRRAGREVEATIWQSLDERHVRDFDEKWKPIFAARLAELFAAGPVTGAIAGEHDLQDAHWKWSEKLARMQGDMSRASFAVEAEGVTQGLMFTHMGPTVRAREPSQQGQYIVDVELVATAPWNRFRLTPDPQFRGIGRLLLATAVSLSFSEEFAGRVGLHALPQAESWYRDVCGMTDLGVDTSGMRYFEMTSAQARAFIA